MNSFVLLIVGIVFVLLSLKGNVDKIELDRKALARYLGYAFVFAALIIKVVNVFTP